MKQQHTPGPWEWDGLGADEYWRLSSRAKRPALDDVIEVHQGAVYSEYSSDPACMVVSNSADAALIAAAPELLAALNALNAVKLNGKNLPLAFDSAEDFNRFQEACRLAVAAIAKAEGRP